MGRRSRIGLAVAVSAVLVVGLAAWWFLRDDPPEELSVDDAIDSSSDDADTGGGAGDLDGAWSIVPDSESQAGLRITESFVGGLTDHVAVGRTTTVEGTVEVAGTEITAAGFTVDLTALEWSDAPGFPTDGRSVALRDQGLETASYPEATFELTEPATVSPLPEAGDIVPLEITGDLTLHGVTRPTTFTVEIARQADQLLVGTATPVPVTLADHDIQAPPTPPRGGAAPPPPSPSPSPTTTSKPPPPRPWRE